MALHGGGYNGRVIASIAAFEKDTARRARRVLLEAEFSESRIAAQLGSTEPGARFEDCLAQWLWRCRNGDPLSVLIRLFVLGQPVSPREAARAVSPMTVEEWEGMGLLRRAKGQVSACVELTPKPGFVFASNFGFADRKPAADHVLGITSSASLVNRCMIRRPVERGLDLGTGTGFLALHMQAHCERVMALDLNPRALAFARFNAAFNLVDGVEFRHSDCFSAVPGERFDQIVGNLPFVISPAGETLFRDGGVDGSGFFESVLRQAPEHLSEGGVAQFLGQWSNRTPEMEIPGCDVFVIRFATEPVEEYATQWVQACAVAGKRGRSREYRAWMEFYWEHGIERIHTGLWNLRRRSGGTHWQASVDRPTSKATWGDRIDEFFRSWGAWGMALAREEIPELRVKLSPYTVWRGEFVQCAQEPRLQLFSSDGFSTPLTIEGSTEKWLALADGTRTVAEMARAGHLGAQEGWAGAIEPLLFHGYLTVA
jgi:SAM-dependent methyltransferase